MNEPVKKKKQLNLPASGQELIETLSFQYSITEGAALVILQQAAFAPDNALEAERLIKKHGMMIQSERGLSQNPMCNVSRDNRNRVLSALKSLHLEL